MSLSNEELPFCNKCKGYFDPSKVEVDNDVRSLNINDKDIVCIISYFICPHCEAIYPFSATNDYIGRHIENMRQREQYLNDNAHRMNPLQHKRKKEEIERRRKEIIREQKDLINLYMSTIDVKHGVHHLPKM